MKWSEPSQSICNGAQGVVVHCWCTWLCSTLVTCAISGRPIVSIVICEIIFLFFLQCHESVFGLVMSFGFFIRYDGWILRRRKGRSGACWEHNYTAGAWPFCSHCVNGLKNYGSLRNNVMNHYVLRKNVIGLAHYKTCRLSISYRQGRLNLKTYNNIQNCD